MVDHLWGVDKSHFDAPTGTARIVAEGFGFMTHKAGGDSPDAELNTWWNDAKNFRSALFLGAYWVLYPGHGAGAADAFLARLDSQCPGWRDGPFILQLDCEIWGGDTSTRPGLADIRACANRLRVLAPKLVPIVYAPRWAYTNTLSGLDFPLWSSAYTSATGSASTIYPGDSYSGWAAYSGVVPSVAQFSSTCTVAGDPTTDVNCFKGTQSDLVALLAPGFSEGTDMTTVDLTPAAVAAIVDALTGLGKQPDGTPTLKLGNVFYQGVPNPFHPELPAPHRTYAYTLLSDIAAALMGLQADVTALKQAPSAAPVDAAALAAAIAGQVDGVTQAQIESAVETAIRDLVNGAPVSAPGTAERAEPVQGDDPVIYDETTRAMREQRQAGIQGTGAAGQ